MRYNCHVGHIAFFLYVFDEGRNVVSSDFQRVGFFPELEISQWVKTSVVLAVSVAASVCNPNIIALVSQDEDLRFVSCIRDPAVSRVN